MTERRFPPPWSVEEQLSISRKNPAGESAAKLLTKEARRIVANMAKLPEFLRKG